MTEAEGVIKFQLQFERGPLSLPGGEWKELNAWRRLLRRLGLVGRDPARYGGYGFGNLSRLSPDGKGFIITASQTGALEDLTLDHYSAVLRCDPAANEVVARGPLPPSSEALTHAAVYAADRHLRWVFHVHSPDIWRHAARLGIPATRPEVPYGTPAMAAEVDRLLRHSDALQRRIFAMGGHEDGVIGFGAGAEQAGCAIVQTLVKSQL